MPIKAPRLPPDVLGAAEVARMLKLSYSTVLTLVADGVLRGGCVRIPRNSPRRPWSRAASHLTNFVVLESVAELLRQPDRLAALQRRRAERSAAIVAGRARRAQAAAGAQ